MAELLKRKKELFLPLDIQYFASGDVDPEGDEVTQQDDPEGGGDDATTTEEKKFTQADLDRIIQERLAREAKAAEAKKAKEAEEAERKRLEEEGEYKELLEATKAELAQYKQAEVKRIRDGSIKDSLRKHGLSEEQVNAHFEWVEGGVKEDSDVDEVVKRYVDNLNLTTTVDPSGGFGTSTTPKPKLDEDVGQELLDRVKGLSRVKYN